MSSATPVIWVVMGSQKTLCWGRHGGRDSRPIGWAMFIPILCPMCRNHLSPNGSHQICRCPEMVPTPEPKEHPTVSSFVNFKHSTFLPQGQFESQLFQSPVTGKKKERIHSISFHALAKSNIIQVLRLNLGC